MARCVSASASTAAWSCASPAGGRRYMRRAGPAEAGDLLVRIAGQLEPVGHPAGGAGNGEEDGEHVDREPHRLVDEPGVEVDVGVELPGDEVVVGQGDLFQLQGDVEERVAAGDLEDPLGGGLDDAGPGVVALVDPVAEAHEAGLALLDGGHEGLDVVER